MVEEGALNGVDALFGIHVNPFLDTGNVGTRAGAMLASADMFEVQIRGAGGHAAMPHRTVDPIVLSAHVINAVHQVVSRRLDPIEAGVITIGTINGGTVNNVIPDVVTMTGTIRSMSAEARKLLREELYRACSIVEPLGGRYHIDFHEGYPVTINDVEAVDVMLGAAAEFLGQDGTHESPKIMGAEDFSYMLQRAPGCMVQLGVHDPAWGDSYYPVHTSTFRMDEEALPIGAASLALAAIRWMEKMGG
jgi:amidohydrolase